MKERIPRETDQEDVEKAFCILMEAIMKHQHKIEPALWVSACISAVQENYKLSGVSKKEYKKDILSCIEHYLKIWDQ